MKQPVQPFARYLVDPDTGEPFAVMIAPVIRRMGGRFVRVFQDTKRSMLQAHPEITGQSLHVLCYCETEVSWNNIVPGPTKLALRFNLDRSAVSRAYGKLVHAEFLLKRDGAYYLSPLVAWRGDSKGYESACRELFPSPALALKVGSR